MSQKTVSMDEGYKSLDSWLEDTGCKTMLLVCGGSIRHQEKILAWLDHIAQKGITVERFSGFQPNPTYENVVDGVAHFRKLHCDVIVAVGGGSAMDVAKAIKGFSQMDGDGDDGSFLRQEIKPDNIPFLAVPTTAGTGSEATRFAVIYYKGEKQSVAGENLIPDAVVLDPDTLATLPVRQKKAAMMDALCHGIESFWSINSTEESKEFSKAAIRGIIENADAYLDNDREAGAKMLQAANIAGKAINITQTTAGHAMCYKITGIFGVPHGHAAILCDRVLFPWMIDNIDKCVDPRGKEYVRNTLDELGRAMGCENAKMGARFLMELFDEYDLEVPCATEEQYKILRESVNPERLKNHPIALDLETIDKLYHEVLR